MKKYNDLINKIMNIKLIKKIKMFENYLYLVDVDENIKNIENLRGNNGIVFQIKLKKLDEISQLITKNVKRSLILVFKNKDFKKFDFEK